MHRPSRSPTVKNALVMVERLRIVRERTVNQRNRAYAYETYLSILNDGQGERKPLSIKQDKDEQNDKMDDRLVTKRLIDLSVLQEKLG